MLPEMLWQQFRNLSAFNVSDIKAADKNVSKAAGIKFSDIRKIFYHTISVEMKKEQVNILVGNASQSAAMHCLLNELDCMMEYYVRGWERSGLVLPVT